VRGAPRAERPATPSRSSRSTRTEEIEPEAPLLGDEGFQSLPSRVDLGAQPLERLTGRCPRLRNEAEDVSHHARSSSRHFSFLSLICWLGSLWSCMVAATTGTHHISAASIHSICGQTRLRPLGSDVTCEVHPHGH